MARPSIIVLPLFVILAGCKVGPDYHAPQTPVEGSFAPLPPKGPAQSYVLTTQASSGAEWWAALNDASLNTLIEEAMSANHDLRLAAARIREARARRAVAGAGEFPRIDASALYSYNRESQNVWPYNSISFPGLPWDYDLYQAGFDASWELDLFGALRRGVEAANADLEASVEERRSVLISVLAEVARNYVELRAYQQQFEIAARNLQVQRETLDLTTDQARKGTATQLDVSRSAAQVSTTEASLPRLRNLQWQAMHRLAVLTGKQPGALVETLSPVKPVPTPPSEISVGVPAELLRRRPDIRQAERNLAAATARVGEAVADLYPRFSLTGFFSLQGSSIKDLSRADSATYGLGPAVQWPIFDAGRVRAVIAVRNAQQEQALARYEQVVLISLEEVHDALAAFVTEQDRRKSLRAAVLANQESTDIAKELYRRGLTDFTAVLDSERQLYQSQEALLESEAAVTTSLVALYKALGGGWEMDVPPEQRNPVQAQQ